MLTFKRDGPSDLVLLRRGQVVGRLWWGEIPADVPVEDTRSNTIDALRFFAPPKRLYGGWLVELDGERRAFSRKAMARAWCLQQEERRTA